jgi:hypothetical protein
MTNYTVKLKMLIMSSDVDEQNIALNRCKEMLLSCFTNGIFINQANTKQIKLYTAAGCKLTTLPEEPLDQVVGIMLFCKLSAVMEGRIQILDLDVSSDIGDLIVYSHGINETVGPFADEGWWNDPEPTHNNLNSIVKKSAADRVVTMQKTQTWKDFGLAWDDDEQEQSQVVYIEFQKKHEDQ